MGERKQLVGEKIIIGSKLLNKIFMNRFLVCLKSKSNRCDCSSEQRALSQAVALEIVQCIDQNLNLYFKHFFLWRYSSYFLYGLHENLSWKFLVQYYLLLAVSREQRVLPAPPEVTPSNKSRGVRPGGALGEDVIWDSACARSALVIELFIFCTKYALDREAMIFQIHVYA